MQPPPVDGVGAEGRAGAQEQRDGEGAQQVQRGAQGAPETEGPEATQGQRQHREESVPHPAVEGEEHYRADQDEGQSARPREIGKGNVPQLGPDPRDGRQSHVPAIGRQVRELPCQDRRVDLGARPQGKPHVHGHDSTGAGRVRSKPHQLRHPARPLRDGRRARVLPAAKRAEIRQSGGKAIDLEASRSQLALKVVRRLLQRQAVELRQALPQPAAQHQPVGGRGNFCPRPETRLQNVPRRRGPVQGLSQIAAAQHHREGVEPEGELLHQQPFGRGRRGVGRPQRPQVGGELQA